MTTLKIKNDEWEQSVRLAQRFIEEFPDRVGYRDGVAFTTVGYPRPFYVYRTKTGIIVVS